MTNIDEILADVGRLDMAATPGPWESTESDGVIAPGDTQVAYCDSMDTQELIATFRTAAPALAAEVRRLRAKLVEAAIEIAGRCHVDVDAYIDDAIKAAERITGIRLKFEDGRFVEDPAK